MRFNIKALSSLPFMKRRREEREEIGKASWEGRDM
jgi:hypothetical protein